MRIAFVVGIYGFWPQAVHETGVARTVVNTLEHPRHCSQLSSHFVRVAPKQLYLLGKLSGGGGEIRTRESLCRLHTLSRRAH
jgi:hypothetical protein